MIISDHDCQERAKGDKNVFMDFHTRPAEPRKHGVRARHQVACREERREVGTCQNEPQERDDERHVRPYREHQRKKQHHTSCREAKEEQEAKAENKNGDQERLQGVFVHVKLQPSTPIEPRRKCGACGENERL